MWIRCVRVTHRHCWRSRWRLPNSRWRRYWRRRRRKPSTCWRSCWYWILTNVWRPSKRWNIPTWKRSTNRNANRRWITTWCRRSATPFNCRWRSTAINSTKSSPSRNVTVCVNWQPNHLVATPPTLRNQRRRPSRPNQALLSKRSWRRPAARRRRISSWRRKTETSQWSANRPISTRICRVRILVIL